MSEIFPALVNRNSHCFINLVHILSELLSSAEQGLLERILPSNWLMPDIAYLSLANEDSQSLKSIEMYGLTLITSEGKISIQLIQQIAIALDLGQLKNYAQFKALTITREHFSSLYYDIKEGKPGEINAIVDATIELAEFLGSHNCYKVLIPDVKPLEILRYLLNQKTKNIAPNKLQLTRLFETCHTSLELFSKHRTDALIRSKL